MQLFLVSKTENLFQRGKFEDTKGIKRDFSEELGPMENAKE